MVRWEVLVSARRTFAVVSIVDDPFMLGWWAAIEESKEQLRRADAWRRGEEELCLSCERAYWNGLAKVQAFQVDEYRQGYMTRWAIEVENLGDRLFPSVSSK
jgi:hypothetical protein